MGIPVMVDLAVRPLPFVHPPPLSCPHIMRKCTEDISARARHSTRERDTHVGVGTANEPTLVCCGDVPFYMHIADSISINTLERLLQMFNQIRIIYIGEISGVNYEVR